MCRAFWEYCFYGSALVLWVLLLIVALLPISGQLAMYFYLLISIAAVLCCASVVWTGRLEKLGAVMDGWWLAAKRLLRQLGNDAEIDDD